MQFTIFIINIYQKCDSLTGNAISIVNTPKYLFGWKNQYKENLVQKIKIVNLS